MKKILKLVICCVLVLGLITTISANTNKTSALGETSNIETKYNYDTIDVNKSPNFHVNDTTSDASRIRTSPHFINTNKFTTSNEKKMHN